MTAPTPVPLPAIPDLAITRFWSRVDRGDVGSCWIWHGGRFSTGYGLFFLHGQNRRAHRVAYEIVIGPIPDEMTLDHLCRNILCCNPAHLEPVTNAVNILRGTSFSATNARKTHCDRGHEFTDSNTLVSGGARKCRACKRAYERERYVSRAVVKTHCIHGHEYTPENTYRPPAHPTFRECRTCIRIRDSKRVNGRDPRLQPRSEQTVAVA